MLLSWPPRAAVGLSALCPREVLLEASSGDAQESNSATLATAPLLVGHTHTHTPVCDIRRNSARGNGPFPKIADGGLQASP